MKKSLLRQRTRILAVLWVAACLSVLALANDPPGFSPCEESCKAVYDADIQACIYFVDPTLTWGECKRLAMSKYRDCKQACNP